MARVAQKPARDFTCIKCAVAVLVIRITRLRCTSLQHSTSLYTVTWVDAEAVVNRLQCYVRIGRSEIQLQTSHTRDTLAR